jgi:phage gp16-like protein
MRSMKRKIKVTTECPGLFPKKRRSGNTTRQANWAVEMILQGSTVKIKDHSLLKVESERLFSIVIKRLEEEHYLEKLISKEQIDINPKTLVIELC